MAIPAPLADKFCHLPPHSCKQDKICLKWLADFPTRRKFSGQSVSLSSLVHWCSCSGCHGAEKSFKMLCKEGVLDHLLQPSVVTVYHTKIPHRGRNTKLWLPSWNLLTPQHFQPTKTIVTPIKAKSYNHSVPTCKLQLHCDISAHFSHLHIHQYLTSIIGKWLMFLLLHKARITYTANSDCRWVSV